MLPVAVESRTRNPHFLDDASSEKFTPFPSSGGMDRDDIFRESGDRIPIALPSGSLLREQFRIGRVLGSGGFGVTYLAFDELLERPVAIKEYFPRHLAVDRTDSNTVKPRSSKQDQDFDFGLQRFLQEARTLAKFEDHPNIVRVRNFFGENGTGYLVMNFYEGYTLEEYIEKQSGWLPEEESLYIVHEVLNGLEAAHNAGVLHRDIDPSNIYLTYDGRVVLLDFGAARAAVGERTQTLSVMLKRGYAPHEQYHSRGEQGPWTDIYACAATLYRTLTGYKPPEAPARVMNEDLVAPQDISPGISEQLNDAIVCGLEVLPQNRPESIASFRAMLPPPPGIQAAAWIEGNVPVHRHEISDTDRGEAVVDITTEAACRLYVNGKVSDILEAGQTVSLFLSRGSHRLRAVRTDRAASSGGTATLTTASTSSSFGHSDYVSLRDLIWQSEVTASPDSPTAVHVAFGENGDDTQKERASDDASSEQSVFGRRLQSFRSKNRSNDPSSRDPSSEDRPGGDAIPGIRDRGVNQNPSRSAGSSAPWSSPPEQQPSNRSTSDDSDPDPSKTESSKTEPSDSAPSDAESPDSDPSDAPSPPESESERPAAAASGESSTSSPVSPGSSTRPDPPVEARGTGRPDDLPTTETGFRPDANNLEESDAAVAMRHAARALRKAAHRARRRARATWWRVRRGATSAAQAVAGFVQSIELYTTSSQPETTEPATADSKASNLRDRVSENPMSSEPAAPPRPTDDTDDGRDESPLSTPPVPAGSPPETPAASGESRDDREPTPGWIDQIDVPPRALQVGGAVLGLLLIFIGGWWALGSGAPAQPVNQPPVTGDDLATTQRAPVTMNVTENDTDPEGRSVRLASVIALPGSVGTVTQLDTARIRFQPAEGFAGVAEIGYTVMDADSAFAQGVARVNIPFRDTTSRVLDAPRDPQVLYPADLDGDQRTDVLTATYAGHRILGFTQRAEEPVVIMEDAEGGIDVSAADMDGDGDTDVLAAAFRNDAVYVIQNISSMGNELTFADPVALPTELPGALLAQPADVNSDGVMDVIAVSQIDGRIVWFENQHTPDRLQFSEAREIASGLDGLETVAVADLDSDGDPDVVSGDYQSDIVAWHENNGGAFTSHMVDDSADGVIAVAVADINADDRPDVLASTAENDRILWYEQSTPDSTYTGPARFEAPITVSTDVDEPESLAAADVDRDGDLDILSASFRSGIVAWHENQGDGTFGRQHTITDDAPEALAVLPIDIDEDGDIDVAAASQGNDTIAWFENAIVSSTPAPTDSTGAAPDSTRAADAPEDTAASAGASEPAE